MEILKYFLFLSTICCLEYIIYCDDTKTLNKNTANDNEEEEYSVFEPTSEWQPLRKDQAIPRGLHVRLNLATGKREAKLLDPNDKDDDMQDVSAVHTEPKDDQPFSNLNVKELKNYLKQIQGDDRLIADDDLERVKRRFRSYDELKEELIGMQTSVKTDAELLEDLMENYRHLVDEKSSSLAGDFKEELEEEELTLLTNMEYMVHQIDNAREFVKTGLKEVAFPSLNSTSTKVRYEATKLLGAAVQNNPRAQVLALEAGTVTVLLRILAIDSSKKVKYGAIFALSALLRRFPSAQAAFIDKGGLTTLYNLFQSMSSDEKRLQVKIIAFINDLLQERKDTEHTLQESRATSGNYLERELVEKLRQYSDMMLELRLREGGWCGVLTSMLYEINESMIGDESMTIDETTARGDNPARPEHDLMDNLSSIMTSMTVACGKEFNSGIPSVVMGLLKRYARLAQLDPDPDSIFIQLRDKIANLASTLMKHNVKDEL